MNLRVIVILNAETFTSDHKGLPSHICPKYESKFCGESRKILVNKLDSSSFAGWTSLSK